MDAEKLERINSFLNEQGSDIETISKSCLSKLEVVDAEIQERLRLQKEASQLLNDSAVNISAISNATGIARKTFYNNELLKAYVERYSSLSKDKNMSENLVPCPYAEENLWIIY